MLRVIKLRVYNQCRLFQSFFLYFKGKEKRKGPLTETKLTKRWKPKTPVFDILFLKNDNGFCFDGVYKLFVGKIPKENIYSVKINMSPLWGALFNSKNLHHPTLIKIRMLKLIIRKANKVVHCGPTACSERRALKSHRLWFIHIFSNQRLESELLNFVDRSKYSVNTLFG